MKHMFEISMKTLTLKKKVK